MVQNELLAVGLGIASAMAWGAGDFSGGAATKQSHAYSVVLISQFMGGIGMLLMALLFGEVIPPTTDLIYGALAGIFGCVGLVTLYYALATGRMGIAAPVSAVIAAAIPVMFSIVTEGLPKTLTLIGFLCAAISVWWIANVQNISVQPRDLAIPTVAGLGFGLFYIFMHRASEVSVFFPLTAARVASVSALSLWMRSIRQPVSVPYGLLPLIMLSGILDAAGNALYALASQTGRLDIAVVLSSLYPAMTILLAWLIFKEHIYRTQMIGIVAALLAIVLIAA